MQKNKAKQKINLSPKQYKLEIRAKENPEKHQNYLVLVEE